MKVGDTVYALSDWLQPGELSIQACAFRGFEVNPLGRIHAIYYVPEVFLSIDDAERALKEAQAKGGGEENG